MPPARQDDGRGGRRGGQRAGSPRQSARGRRSRRARGGEGEVAGGWRTAQKTAGRGARWLLLLVVTYKPRRNVGQGGGLCHGGLRRDAADNALGPGEPRGVSEKGKFVFLADETFANEKKCQPMKH